MNPLQNIQDKFFNKQCIVRALCLSVCLCVGKVAECEQWQSDVLKMREYVNTYEANRCSTYEELKGSLRRTDYDMLQVHPPPRPAPQIIHTLASEKPFVK